MTPGEKEEMRVHTYQKVPYQVEAIRATGSMEDGDYVPINWNDIAEFTGHQLAEISEDGHAFKVFNKTHNNWHRVLPGEWVIRGVSGEFYPCDNDTFHKSYTRVS